MQVACNQDDAARAPSRLKRNGFDVDPTDSKLAAAVKFARVLGRCRR